MADAFAPQFQGEVRFNQPVEMPAQQSGLGAVADLVNMFGRSFSQAQESRAGTAPKVDQNLGVFRQGLERVEAIRQERGETAALVAERQLASNFAMAGINLDDDYKDVYEKTTGRTWAGYGADNEARIMEETLKDPQVQASYVASFAVNKDWTEEQRIEYAIGQKATLQAAENEIARSKAEAGYKWGVQTEAAYSTAVETFLNVNLGALMTTAQQGGRVTPQDIANLTAQWGQLKVKVSRPPGISDDQWKATQDKLSNVDNMLATFQKASSSEVLLETLTTGIARDMLEQGGGSLESRLAGIISIKDPASLNGLVGDVSTFMMGASGSLNLNVPTPDLFGHVLESQGGLAAETDPNAIITVVPDDIKKKLEDKTHEQIYKGLEAAGLLTSVIGPADLSRPEARQQFVENATTIGAVLMNNPSDQFLSDAALKKLIANPQFIRNINALEVTDPEAYTVARQFVRGGLSTELARQQRNLEAIESNLGVVWNGSAYVLDKNALIQGGMTAQQADGFINWVGKTYGGDTKALADGLIPMPPGMNFKPVGLQQALDRRAAISTIEKAMKALEVEVAAPEGQDATAAVATTGSVTAQLLDKFEGGGDYNALFGFANRQGGQFEGTNVSQMTIGELKAFSDGEYADYSRKQLGYKATPMGRYQFVGSTLAAVASRMGLPDDTVFSPEVQDQMFVFHAKEVMDGKSPQGKRAALRGTWEGLRNATDSELDQMISEIEGGTASFGTTGIDAGVAARGARPTDANAVAAAAGGAAQRAIEANPPAALPTPAPVETPPATSEAATAELPVDFSNAATGVMPQQEEQVQAPVVDAEVQALIDNLSSKTKRQLKAAGIEPSSLKFFETDAAAEAAIESGELKEGDAYILPNGQVNIVEGD